MLRSVQTPVLVLLFAFLGGCGPNYSPDTYSSAAVQQANKVEQGVVVGVRQVGVTAQGVAGAVTGGAAGGIVGSQAPGGSAATAFGVLGGTVIGGLVGTTVEHTTGDTKAFEYIVRKPSSELVSVTQKDAVPLALGQRVLVIAGSQARVVPDYTVVQDAPTSEPAAARLPAPATPTRDTPTAPVPVAAAAPSTPSGPAPTGHGPEPAPEQPSSPPVTAPSATPP